MALPEGGLIAVYAAIVIGAAMFRPTAGGAPPSDIPVPDSGAVATPHWPREIDVPVEAGRWTAIVVHHSATEQNTPEEMDRFHRQERGWGEGLGYHFVICNGSRGTVDGQIYVGRRWIEQLRGAHCVSKGSPIDWNKVSVGICLVGDFTHHGPTPAQMASLVELVNYLRGRCRIPLSHVYGHRDAKKNTECPGKSFPWRELVRRLGSA